jgi:hypothetical protein
MAARRGSAALISGSLVAGAATAGVLLDVLLPHKEFVAVTLDREMARAPGLRVFRLDPTLYVPVTPAVVTAVQTIGNVLVPALLVTPAATPGSSLLEFVQLLARVLDEPVALVGAHRLEVGPEPAEGGAEVLAVGRFAQGRTQIGASGQHLAGHLAHRPVRPFGDPGQAGPQHPGQPRVTRHVADVVAHRRHFPAKGCW